MKKIFATLLILSSVIALAQAPKKFNYQCIARNTGGAIIPNQLVSFDMAIRQTTAGGTIVYEETQQATTNSYGLVNIMVGTGTVVTGSMNAINWANGPYFMEVKIDPTGGTTYTLTGTQELLSVPYALYAENSGTPGPQGVGIDSTYVLTDSLFIHYTNNTTMNAGYVKGNTGAQGVSVTNASVSGGVLTFTLSNSSVIYAGNLPYKSHLPYSLTTVYSINTAAYSQIPVAIMVPPLYGTFTTITAEVSYHYMTNNVNTSGNIGLVDYGNGSIVPITGSVTALPTTNSQWVNITGTAFSIQPGTVIRPTVQRVAGTGTVNIDGITVTITYN